ncbi:MAG: GNAT family N-acetyltransferase [Flavisolibacter sp.]
MDRNISVATIKDIDKLMLLVNSAYRGESAKKGWTHEANLIEGNLRTDEKSLEKMINDPNATILKYEEGEQIIGCVYLEKKNTSLYLGLLTVSPELQAKGIGKKLLKAADEYAIQNYCNKIEMTVISARSELIAWYERNGFFQTNQKQPFPDNERFGTPVKPIEFVVMERQIDSLMFDVNLTIS